MSLSFEMPPGYRLEKFDNLDSTNEEAKRRAQTGAAPGLIISAQSQSAGRGRQGRTWISPSGGLYFSILLRPTCPAAKAAQLSFVSALAVGEGIATSLRDPERLCFKWPNDVLIGMRKVAGILLESGSGSKNLEWLVVGIGINIASHPENMNYPATCLIHETGTACDPAQVLVNVVHAFDKWCRIWEGEGFEPLRVAWLDRARGLKTEIEVRLFEHSIRGVFQGLAPDGALRLEVPGEGERIIPAGDVYFPVQS
jgi:BirA family biotin operon repressor/biotin-[acetyl-CoA-carboxylase] ligase